jgi:hypothetical protein
MKSLSILLLLATLSSVLIGALFAVTPTAAGSGTPPEQIEVQAAIQDSQSSQNLESEVPTVEIQLVEEDLSAELTQESNTAEAPSNDEPTTESDQFDPGTLMSVAFSSENLQKASIPETGTEADVSLQAAAIPQTNYDLASFTESVSTGSANQITGVYADGALALRVGQQPGSDPAYVTNRSGEVTQFGLASAYGSLGLLAHNILSGIDFFNVTEGQVVTLIYGDGSSQSYQVQSIRSFEALQPNSIYSDFVDLDFGGNLSSSELFRMMYDQDDTLVLQTCISHNGISTWGRLFVIATPVSN